MRTDEDEEFDRFLREFQGQLLLLDLWLDGFEERLHDALLVDLKRLASDEDSRG